MIITLTLNPAVDKTMEIDNFEVDSVNRVGSVRLDAGGKGINVSKVIKVLGEESLAMGILAGKAGEFVLNRLNDFGIENDFVFIDGETRTNIKIVDKTKGTNTDINEKGPSVPSDKIQLTIDNVMGKIQKDSILVLSGSVSNNIHSEIYKELIIMAKQKGARTILDADGELLKKGLEGGPYLVKPNIHELERLYGVKIHNTTEAIELAKRMFDQGVQLVVLSLGASGSVFLTKEKDILVQGIKVDTVSTVGAGDSMVAAMAVALKRSYSIEEALTLAVAASTASVMTSGTEPGDIEVIRELSGKVYYKYL